jgi:hypothetical protein
MAASAAALSACVAAREPPTAAGSGYDAIEFELKSWGIPVDSWKIARDGSGTYVATVRAQGGSFQDYKLEHHAFQVSPERFAEAAALAASLPPQPNEADCKRFATDMPYGSLRRSRAGVTDEIRFNTGCRDTAALAFTGRLQELDALVAGWGKGAPVTRVEDGGRR